MIELPDNFEQIVAHTALLMKHAPRIDAQRVANELTMAEAVGYPLACRGVELMAEYLAAAAEEEAAIGEIMKATTGANLKRITRNRAA